MAARILIVDDDHATRSGLVELLQDHGHEVTAVGTLHEALDALRTGSPDLVVADVRLGAFNGLQIVMASSHVIPTIMITGFSDPVLESDARRAGADYVVKPIAPTTLLALVERRLAETTGRTPGSTRVATPTD